MSKSKKNLFRQALDNRSKINIVQKIEESEIFNKRVKPTFEEHRETQIRTDYIYLKQKGEKRTPVEKICFKYEVERPVSFIGMMNLRYLEPPDFENLGYIPDAEKELSYLIGEITDTTNEKVLYLEAVKNEAKNELYHDLQNNQFKRVIQAANEMLEFLDGGSHKHGKKVSSDETGKKDHPRESISRRGIIDKAHSLKENGMSVEDMFLEMKKWLLTDLDFTNDQLEYRFGFRLHEHEEAHHTFNKFVNKNRF